jgi:hypothetical protein
MQLPKAYIFSPQKTFSCIVMDQDQERDMILFVIGKAIEISHLTIFM